MFSLHFHVHAEPWTWHANRGTGDAIAGFTLNPER